MQYGRVAALVLIVGLPGAGKTTDVTGLIACDCAADTETIIGTAGRDRR